jgi:hypothetical protein
MCKRSFANDGLHGDVRKRLASFLAFVTGIAFLADRFGHWGHTKQHDRRQSC